MAEIVTGSVSFARLRGFAERFSDWVRGLSGWRRFVFAVVVGLFSALAFAPYGLFPFLLIGFAALVLLIDGAAARPKPIRNAAFIG
jgi:apolipoprotein N-acyltransferase